MVLAGVQTAGRGTHGRTWLTDPGAAILLSVVLDLPPVPATWLTVVASIAVVEAVADVCGIAATLTWPNDVMVQGRKLAGVLTEVHAGSPSAIVGIGINLATPAVPLPADAVPPIGLDDAMGCDADPNAVVIALARRLAVWHRAIMYGDLPAAHTRWRALLGTLGRQVAIRTADGELRGTAVDVDGQGALVVALPDGRMRTVASGRVRELPAAAGAPAGH